MNSVLKHFKDVPFNKQFVLDMLEGYEQGTNENVVVNKYTGQAMRFDDDMLHLRLSHWQEHVSVLPAQTVGDFLILCDVWGFALVPRYNLSELTNLVFLYHNGYLDNDFEICDLLLVARFIDIGIPEAKEFLTRSGKRPYVVGNVNERGVTFLRRYKLIK